MDEGNAPIVYDWVTATVGDPQALANACKQLSDRGWTLVSIFPFATPKLIQAGMDPSPVIVMVGFRVKPAEETPQEPE